MPKCIEDNQFGPLLSIATCEVEGSFGFTTSVAETEIYGSRMWMPTALPSVGN